MQSDYFQSLNACSFYCLEDRLTELREAGNFLPTAEALHLIWQIVDGLILAHHAGIIHKDLRPDYIFIPEGNKPAYINFELNRMLVLSPLAADISSLNELDYASPEQIKGQELSIRSNIYTLGIILYELLAGHLPQAISSRWDVFDREGSELPSGVPLNQARESLTEEIYQLVHSCLWHEEWNRFEDLNKVRAAINLAIAAEEALQDNLAEEQKNRWLLYAAVPVFLAILFIGFMVLWLDITDVFPQSIFTPQPATIAIQATPSKDILASTIQSKLTAQPAVSIAKASAPLPTLIDDGPESLLRLIAPPPDSKYVLGDTISFDWIWPEQLNADHLFAIYMLSGDDRTLIDTVTRTVGDNKYHLDFNSKLASSISGSSSWQVVLEEKLTGKVLAKSELSSIILSPQNTPTSTSTPTFTMNDLNPTSFANATEMPASGCKPFQPIGWLRYIVESGDTILNLATRSGATVEDIQRVNCLNQTLIYAGQTLWLPQFSNRSTQEPTPTPIEQSTPPQPILSPTLPTPIEPTPKPPAKPSSEPTAEPPPTPTAPLPPTPTPLQSEPPEQPPKPTSTPP